MSSGSTNEQATSSACGAEGRVQRAGRSTQGLEGTIEVYQAENRKKCVPDTKKAILKKKKKKAHSAFFIVCLEPKLSSPLADSNIGTLSPENFEFQFCHNPGTADSGGQELRPWSQTDRGLYLGFWNY